MKKSKWLSFDLDDLNAKDTKIKRKPPKNNSSKNLINFKNDDNFHKKLTPTDISDLAVHPKKIKEVEDWFKTSILNKPPHKKTTSFLLITGPPGSGKTITVQVISRINRLTITEWVNPVDHDYEIMRGLNQIEKFTEFLTESKWGSLIGSNENKIILIEEFPNTILRNPEQFPDILEDVYYKNSNPIIFICSESADNTNSNRNVSQILFPQELRNKLQISHISFNATAPTLLKTALKRAQNYVTQNSNLKLPSQQIIDTIINSSMGDIRCAVNQFYFASLLGTTNNDSLLNLSTIAKHSNRKRKRFEKMSTAMSRDENLGLFHSLGRVLNPKRTDDVDGNGWRIDCDLDKLIDEFSSQPKIFLSFLHENYIKYFGDINDIYVGADILSFAQMFLDVWTEREDTLLFALWTAVLGLMIANEHKVSKWLQIKGPTKVKVQRIDVGTECKNLTSTDMFYYNLIKKRTKVGDSSINQTVFFE